MVSLILCAVVYWCDEFCSGLFFDGTKVLESHVSFCILVSADKFQPYPEPYLYVGRGKNKVGTSPDILLDSVRFNIEGVHFVMEFETCVGNVDWATNDGVCTQHWDQVTVMNR